MSDFQYMSGFGNECASEALAEALPKGQNNPQRAPYGLFAEQLSGSSFTMPRDKNQRSWFYRIRPSVLQGEFEKIDSGLLRGAPFNEMVVTPNQLRWDAMAYPDQPKDFIESMITMGGSGSIDTQVGYAVHLYACTVSMKNKSFYNADGELLIVPEQGALLIQTEFGLLDVAPGEICVIGRGIKFKVTLPEKKARGYICENYGHPFRLPDLGPIGANGLANPRDFLSPVAHYEDKKEAHALISKFNGHLWKSKTAFSPFDVVAWHGNYAPYKYDLKNFNTINTVSFDHCDPSIFTVLTSPSSDPGMANVDFVIFPERWMVAEHTFRPPYYHRNIMSEFMGLIFGVYDAKAEGFAPGGSSIHNCMSAHGPDAQTFEKATQAKLNPDFQKGTLAFMFESRYICKPTKAALISNKLQKNYQDCWQGLKSHFNPKKR